MRLSMILILTIGASHAYAAQRYKFRTWLPYYDYLWQRRAETCAPQIHRYHTNNRTGVHPAVCAAVVDCLLTNVTQSIQSKLASADILLGLTPQILSLAGPSRGELAVLSTHEPIFTGLLSFGFPSMFVTNLFGSVDVAEIFRKPAAKTARTYHSWLRRQSKTSQWCALAILIGLAVRRKLHAADVEHIGMLDRGNGGSRHQDAEILRSENRPADKAHVRSH